MKLLRYNLPALPLEQGDRIVPRDKNFVIVYHKNGTHHMGYMIK